MAGVQSLVSWLLHVRGTLMQDYSLSQLIRKAGSGLRVGRTSKLPTVCRAQLHPQPDRGLAADAADARESDRMFSGESASPLALAEAWNHVPRSGTQAASH